MRIPTTCSERIRLVTSGVTAVVMASLLASCAGSPTFSRTVYEDPTVLLRLDSPLVQGQVSTAPAEHIPELTAADLAKILRSVRIQSEISFLSYWILRKEPQSEPAFPMRMSNSSPLISRLHWAKPGPMKRQYFSSSGPARMAFLLSRQAFYSSKAISSASPL